MILNLDDKTPFDIRRNLVEKHDRLIIGQKDDTESGYTTSITFARVIKIDYLNQRVLITTPKSCGEVLKMSFKKLRTDSFLYSKSYFKSHTNEFKCHMGSIRDDKKIDINDRVIYVNSKLNITIGRVLNVQDSGDIEIIGYGKMRSNIIPKDEVSRKVFLYTKNFFKNHRGDKCYDSHLEK